MEDLTRERAVVHLLEQYGHMSVEALSQSLFVSQSTTRRILNKLERESIVHRSHGDVMLASDGLPQSISLRNESMRREKRAIAAAASRLIRNNTVLFIDTSTTVKYTIEFLRKKNNVTVVTNSLPALVLLQTYGIPAKCTGGNMENGSCGFVGYHTEKYLSGLYADLFLFSTPCINQNGRISDYSEQETFVRQQMMENAKRTAFLFDHTKIGKDGTFTVCSIKDVDYLISDKDLSTAFLRKDGTRYPLYPVDLRDTDTFMAATRPELCSL